MGLAILISHEEFLKFLGVPKCGEYKFLFSCSQNTICCTVLREVFLKTITTTERRRWALGRKPPWGYRHSIHAARGGFSRQPEKRQQGSRMLAELESCSSGLLQGLWGMPCNSCTWFLEHSLTQQTLLEKYYCSFPEGLLHKYLFLFCSFIPVSLRSKDHKNLRLGMWRWSLYITVMRLPRQFLMKTFSLCISCLLRKMEQGWAAETSLKSGCFLKWLSAYFSWPKFWLYHDTSKKKKKATLQTLQSI